MRVSVVPYRFSRGTRLSISALFAFFSLQDKLKLLSESRKIREKEGQTQRQPCASLCAAAAVLCSGSSTWASPPTPGVWMRISESEPDIMEKQTFCDCTVNLFIYLQKPPFCSSPWASLMSKLTRVWVMGERRKHTENHLSTLPRHYGVQGKKAGAAWF